MIDRALVGACQATGASRYAAMISDHPAFSRRLGNSIINGHSSGNMEPSILDDQDGGLRAYRAQCSACLEECLSRHTRQQAKIRCPTTFRVTHKHYYNLTPVQLSRIT